ncbi:hypothetical protein L5876_14665, partial [Hyphobacterium sp. SN044]|uniref:hypothetical protein n=1 Tax=Hyphobacterium sp. SN044 TaxID=2912575 RepID=UPI001F41FFE6
MRTSLPPFSKSDTLNLGACRTCVRQAPLAKPLPEETRKFRRKTVNVHQVAMNPSDAEVIRQRALRALALNR